MTTPKPHRRDEILDAAERRFARQGFAATSVAELIADTDIAKGTFYHHFASKDEVMHAVIERQVERLAAMAADIVDDAGASATERLLRLVSGGERPDGSAELAGELESSGNELMHATALTATIRALSPIMARLLEQGTATGEFDVADPEATAAVVLASTAQLLDDDVLGWRRDGATDRVRGFVAVMARLLGLAPDALSDVAEGLLGGRREGGAGG